MTLGTNVPVGQGVQMGFDVVPEGLGQARLAGIDGNAEQDFPSSGRHDRRLLAVDDKTREF